MRGFEVKSQVSTLIARLQERQVHEFMMYAIIETGGKQYRVAEGDVVFIEKLNVESGDTVTFDRVFAVIDDDASNFGTPVIAGATVTASVIKNGKDKKVRVFKMKSKKGYRNTKGHRQPYTQVQIGTITA